MSSNHPWLSEWNLNFSFCHTRTFTTELKPNFCFITFYPKHKYVFLLFLNMQFSFSHFHVFLSVKYFLLLCAILLYLWGHCLKPLTLYNVRWLISENVSYLLCSYHILLETMCGHYYIAIYLSVSFFFHTYFSFTRLWKSLNYNNNKRSRYSIRLT